MPVNRAVYIAMPDGTRLAADIWLPDAAAAGERVGTLVSFTRYWRARAFEPRTDDIGEIATRTIREGYAAVLVDCRGSGASFGSRSAEFSTQETRDFKFVIDWIGTQPWSNGRVATIGISYAGNTAEHAAHDPSAALVAAVPGFTDFDAYTSILFPGGLRNILIAESWSARVRALDCNVIPVGEWRGRSRTSARLLGVKPVDDDEDGLQLAQAVLQHTRNQDFARLLLHAQCRDDLHLTGDLDGGSDSTVTPQLLRQQSQCPPVDSYHWGSWMDAGTADGVLARFVSDPAGAHYLIGAWSHGGELDANVFRSGDTPIPADTDWQYARIFEFLAPRLGDRAEPNSAKVAASVPALRPGLTYFTMGENVWKHTFSWPVAGCLPQRWFLGPRGALQISRPDEAGGTDRYAVNFEAGTGRTTRWTTQLGGADVYYADRREADSILLTYTTPAFQRNVEITGHPLLTLYVSSSHEDGAIITYLESVSPEGKVTMLTEGGLRLIHRLHGSFERKDAAPMEPGEIAEVSITMLPTSVRIPKGHSLRLAIAGHDRDTFARYPVVGTPVLQVHRTHLHASELTLPCVEAMPAC